MIFSIYGCSSELECGVEDKDSVLFHVEVVGSPQTLIRRVREDYVIAIFNSILITASIGVFIFLAARKRLEIFFIVSLALIITGSFMLVLASVYSILFHDKVMLYNAISAQVFSWFHCIFALEYLFSSLTVPIECVEQDIEVRERNSKKYFYWIRGFQLLSGAVIPLIWCFFPLIAGKVNRLYILAYAIPTNLNLISTVVITFALCKINRFVRKHRDWHWGK